jgi:hypothetical protein
MADPRDPRAGRSLKGVPPLSSGIARPSAPARAGAGPSVPARPAASRPSSARPSSPSRAPRRPLVWLVRPVLWAALLSLAVTLLRLVGELRGWSPEYWSRLPGGGLSPLGIVWLVPVFGFYFGWRLQASGERPWSLVQVALQPPIVALLAGGGALLLARMRASGHMRPLDWSAWLGLWAVLALVAAVLAFPVWPALGRALLAYALLARIPVAVIMALAMYRAWGTHYDALPPGFPVLSLLRRWLWIGLLPQLTIWVAVTLAAGAPFGALGALAKAQLSRIRRAR